MKRLEKHCKKIINKGYFEKLGMGEEFINIRLTENGMRIAEAILLNEKASKNKIIVYILEKFAIPIIVAVIISVITTYITIKNKQ